MNLPCGGISGCDLPSMTPSTPKSSAKVNANPYMPPTKRGNENAHTITPSLTHFHAIQVLAPPAPSSTQKPRSTVIITSQVLDPIVVGVGKARILERICRCRRRIPRPRSRHSPGVVVGVVVKRIPPGLRPKRVVVVAADGARRANLAARRGAVRVRIVGARAAATVVRSVEMFIMVVVMVVVVVVIVVSHVDAGIGLLVAVGREREGGLVWVDVLAAELGAVVAWQAVVPLEVFEGPDADEGRRTEQEAAGQLG